MPSSEEKKEKKEKGKGKKGQEPKEPAIDVTTVHLVNNPDFNKVTHCGFHQVLPWVVLTPKHGHHAVVWDYAAGKLISDLALVELLSAQRPHPNAASSPGSGTGMGSWNSDLIGQIIHVSFVDENCLMWQRFLAQTHVRPIKCFVDAASGDGEKEESISSGLDDPGARARLRQQAAGSTPLLAQVGPQHDNSEEFYFSSLSNMFSTTSQSKDPQHSDQAALTALATAGSEGTRDTSILIVAENVALVVSVGTSTVHRVMITSSVANRVIVSAFTLPVVGPSNPIVVMGCNDGCLLLWDPIRAIAIQDSGEEIEELGLCMSQGALLKKDCVSIHQTPHSSAILSLVPFLVVLPKPCGYEDQVRIDVEGASTFRRAYLSVVIGTEGGSVTMLRLHNRDDNEVLFTSKKVHDKVLSVCSSPHSPQERHVDAGYIYDTDVTGTEFNEFINSLSAATFVYSLGPAHLVQHDSRNGSEIRKVKVPGLELIDLIPGVTKLFMVSKESRQYSISYDLNQNTTQKAWLGVEPLIERSRRLASSSATTTTTGPGGAQASAQSLPGRSKVSTVVPIQRPGPGALDALIDFDGNQKLYRMVMHPLLPNTTIGLCTNTGLLLADITVRRSGDITFVQQLPRLMKPLRYQASGEEGISVAPTAVSAYSTATSAMSGVVGSDGVLTEERYEFAFCEGDSGKAATAVLKMTLDEIIAAPSTSLLLPLLGETASGQSVASAASARRNEHVVSRLIVSEANPTFKVVSLHPSPNGCLVAALTDSKEVQLYDASHSFSVLSVPPLGKPDCLVWSASSTNFAVMSFETKKITVASVKKVPGQKGHTTYAVHNNPHEVIPANVAVGISGGRWLCVHYQASFSGLSSQFYKWEAAMAGGGAVGGFLPQPLFIKWDRLATLCAMAYPTCIVFMEARRKVFTRVNSVDVSTPPTDILFCNKALFVMFEREIMMLLPTRNIVQKIIVASINPALVTQTLDISAAQAQQSSSSGGGGANASRNRRISTTSSLANTGSMMEESEEAKCFSYRAALRPPGKLALKGVIRRHSSEDPEKHAFALIVADEVLQCFMIPLSNSLAHLLFMIHSYTSIASNPAERLFVQRRLLSAAGVDTRAVEGDDIGHLGGNKKVKAGQHSNSMFTVAVYKFCADCGCDVLSKAAEAGLMPNAMGTTGAVGGGINEDELLTAEETSVVDLRAIEEELRWLTQEKHSELVWRAKKGGTATTVTSPSSLPSSNAEKQMATAEVMSRIVRKLANHAAEIHAAGWTTEDTVLRAALEAISAAASRLRVSSAGNKLQPGSPAANSSFDRGSDSMAAGTSASASSPLGGTGDREAWKTARYEVLMDVAFELFKHLPVG